jgi:F1F0 ATPase subunit 2
MITEAFLTVMAFLWGLFLGVGYFGGLWVTARCLPGQSRPQTFWFFSFILRLILAMIGMWFVLERSTIAFLVTLAAFMMVRFIMINRIGRVSFLR